MRILHIDSGREMRGGQWQVLYLLNGLRGLGHEVFLDAPAGAPLARMAAAFRLPLAGGFDVIHAHDARAHTKAALRFARTAPLVVSRRVGFPVRKGLLSRWKYGRASHYIAVSQFAEARMREAGIKPETISVVYDGVPAREFRAAPEDGPVLALRNEDTMEGTELVREAAARTGTAVLIAEDLSRDLERAWAFAYVSGVQGLGSAAILAMAAGVPVVASASGGLPEVVEHGRTGFLVQSTVDSIACALARLREEPALRQKMCREAHLRAMTKFSIESMVRGTEAVYERLLG